jgi:hypothetical protein
MEDSKETKKKSTRGVNMSEVEGSASNSIVKWWSTYKFEDMSPEQIYTDVKNVIPDDRLDEPKVKNLFRTLSNAKDNTQAAIAIGNFILSGDNVGIIVGTKEKDKKYLKNMGRRSR